jgi:dTDP-glucose 4,6-dehydratase
MNKIIITGGLGFIGSNLTKKLLENNKVLVIDKMTYAANNSNLSKFNNNPNFFF